MTSNLSRKKRKAPPITTNKFERNLAIQLQKIQTSGLSFKEAYEQGKKFGDDNTPTQVSTTPPSTPVPINESLLSELWHITDSDPSVTEVQHQITEKLFFFNNSDNCESFNEAMEVGKKDGVVMGRLLSEGKLKKDLEDLDIKEAAKTLVGLSPRLKVHDTSAQQNQYDHDPLLLLPELDDNK